jgi:hypothetical protein
VDVSLAKLYILLIIKYFVVFNIRNIQGRSPLGGGHSTEAEGSKMKKMRLLGIVPLAVVILAQCAAGPQRWPEYERRAEDRMMLLQEKIGEGLKTNAMTPAHAQDHLARLEDIRRDYRVLRDKMAYREEWDGFFRRLDLFEAEVNKDLVRPARVELPRVEDRIISLQRRIDDGRSTGRLTSAEARDFQSRLDAIRGDYSRMMEGRPITYEERADILRRLDLLETDLNRFR